MSSITNQNYILYVQQQDLNDYFYSLKERNKIRRFLRHISKGMPKSLRNEFDCKFNDLVQIPGTENEYKFFSKQCSGELQKYLDKFLVIMKS